jgi:DNA-directed RNA polymerase subunit RPC12/RpoP
VPDLRTRHYHCSYCQQDDLYTNAELESTPGRCHYCGGRNLAPLLEPGETAEQINLMEEPKK